MVFRTYRIVLLSAVSFIIFMFSSAPFAHAESVQWNQAFSGSVYSVDGILSKEKELFFSNPSVTVEYRAHMEDADSGQPIPSGSTILEGTRVRFKFEPHEYTDISWFGTGASYDSPFGDWSAGAVAPPIACHPKDFVGTDSNDKNQGDIYASLAVHQPAKSIVGLDALTCEAVGSDGSRVCVMSSEGEYKAEFIFGSSLSIQVPTFKKGDEIAPTPQSINGTYGYFYPRFKSTAGQCGGSNKPMTQGKRGDDHGDGPAFAVNPPIQKIPVTIRVAPRVGTAPNQPSVSAGAAACVADIAFQITMTASDPDGDNIRYGIDWDANGTVDQWVPPSGYVPSGTSQNASRTYATSGTKTVRVAAQDENGALSSFASISFGCSGSVDDDAVAGFNEDASFGSDGSGSFVPQSPILTIRAIPSLVRSGDTTKVNWSASNVESCTVSGTNGDSWSGLASQIGGETSLPITTETTFALRCIDGNNNELTREAVVRILPSWRER